MAKSKAAIRHRVAYGAALITAVRLFSRGLDMTALIVLARYLRPADFGLVAIALSVVQITEAILEMQTDAALLQLRSINRSRLNTAFTLAILRGLILSGTLAALSYPLAVLFEDQRLIPLICALSLAPTFRGLRSPKMVLLFKQMRFSPDAVAELIGKGGGLIVAVTLALTTQSYWAIAAGTIANPLFYTIASHVLAPIRPKLTLAHRKEFYRFLGWGMAAQTFSALNWQTDRFVLGKLASHATVGLFATTRDLAAIAYKVIFDSMQRPILWALSRSSNDEARQRQAYLVTLGSVLAVGLPIACGQALLGREFVVLILGPKWLTATIIFQVVSLSLIPDIYTAMTTTMLYAKNRPEQIFSRNFYDFAFRVPTTIAAIFLFGWQGAVGALFAANLFLAGMCMFVIRSTAGISLFDQVKPGWRAAIGTVAMAGVVILLRGAWPQAPEGDLQNLLIVFSIVPVAAITYGIVLWSLWLLAGKPDGIEKLIIQIAGRFLDQIKLRTASVPHHRPE